MVFGEIFSRAKKYIGNFFEGVKKFGQIDKSGKRVWLMPGYNFLGPGNSVEDQIKNGVKPKNKTDEAAMHHDLDYSEIWDKHKQGKIDKSEMNRRVRESDNRFINHLQNNGESHNLGNILGRNLIKLKNWGEDLGVVSHDYFLRD
jgi:hypothetical protein